MLISIPKSANIFRTDKFFNHEIKTFCSCPAPKDRSNTSKNTVLQTKIWIFLCVFYFMCKFPWQHRYFSWGSTAEVLKHMQRTKAAPFKTLLSIEVYIWSENISSQVTQHLMWSLTLMTPLLFIITLESSLFTLWWSHLYHLLPFI